VEIASSSSLEDSSDKMRWGQANLSLIDNIFSLLVNIQDHTYEFETNLEDRIIKRLKAYCEGEEKLHWIFNSEVPPSILRHGTGSKGVVSALLPGTGSPCCVLPNRPGSSDVYN
jgi:hypothetical protein